MSFGFRVAFTLNGEGSLTSAEEFISFVASREPGRMFRLSSGTAGVSIGSTDRFSISGGSFESEEAARAVAEKVRVALLRRATVTRRGIDLGEHALKGFMMSTYGKQYVAALLKVPAVQEDHLGITVFRDDPGPKFVRMNATASVSTQAQAMVDDLAATIGRYAFATEHAEVAAGIYALSHFVGRAPARFLLLFVSLEALFESRPRSEGAQQYVQSLIEGTRKAPLPPDERDAISSALTFLKSESIAQTGRALARRLGGNMYQEMEPAAFFSHLYKMRNAVVHGGKMDTPAMHSVLGEMDRFVSDLISLYYAES